MRRRDHARARRADRAPARSLDADARMEEQERPSVSALDHLDAAPLTATIERVGDHVHACKPLVGGLARPRYLMIAFAGKSGPTRPDTSVARSRSAMARAEGVTMTSFPFTPNEEFETRMGLTYATHDGVALAGDLYAPKGAGPFPGWWRCTAAAGCRACAAPFNIGGRISRRAAMRCSRSAIGWRRPGRRLPRMPCTMRLRPCSSCAPARRSSSSIPSGSA